MVMALYPKKINLYMNAYNLVRESKYIHKCANLLKKERNLLTSYKLFYLDIYILVCNFKFIFQNYSPAYTYATSGSGSLVLDRQQEVLCLSLCVPVEHILQKVWTF